MSLEKGPARLSVTGIDGSGEDTAWQLARKLLPPEARVLQIGNVSDPSLIIQGEREIVVDGDFAERIGRVCEKAANSGDRRLMSLAVFAATVARWRFQESRLTRQEQPDLVVSVRDPYADGIAYAPVLLPPLARLTIGQRLALLRHLHGAPVRDEVVFLDIEPTIAMRRIRQRGKAARTHETIFGLTRIRDEFGRALSYLSDKCGARTVSFDSGNNDPQKVAIFLAGEILQQI